VHYRERKKTENRKQKTEQNNKQKELFLWKIAVLSSLRTAILDPTMSLHNTNLPDGTYLYMQPAEGSPILTPIRYNAQSPPSFTVEDPRYPSRTEIGLRHLVGYYCTYVGQIDVSFFDNEENALGILFITDHAFQKDRSMKDLQDNYKQGHAFEDNDTCDEEVDIPWAEDSAPSLDSDDVLPDSADEIILSIMKDLEKEDGTHLTGRIRRLNTLHIEEKAKEMDRIQSEGLDMAAQLEALDKKYMTIEQYMTKIRAVVRGHRAIFR